MSNYLNEIPLPKFWFNYFKKTADKGRISSALFELTYKCNLKCAHCYLDRTHSSRKELNLKEIYLLLNQLSQTTCFCLTFTGGEIFKRSDLFKILDYTRRKGFKFSLLTNATLINPKTAKTLKQFSPYIVTVPLYGSNDEVHDRITGLKGSFRRSLEAIKLLKDNKITVGISTVVMKQNKDEFPKIKQLAQTFEVRLNRGLFLSCKANCSTQPLKYRLSVKEMLNFIKRNRRKTIKVKDDYLKVSKANTNQLFYCSAGKGQVAFDPYGNIKPCLNIPFPKYNALKLGVQESLSRIKDYMDNITVSKNYKCSRCHLYEFCARCPADALLEKQDIEACLPYYKRLALASKKLNEKLAVKKLE